MPDWDQDITTIENADLLLFLASDLSCPKRATVLKCLYSLVGSSVSQHKDKDILKINALLDKAKTSTDSVILNWVDRSKVILEDLRKFDYVEWCQGGFSEQDLPILC